MNRKYIDLVVFLLFITVIISPIAAANANTNEKIYPTGIYVSGNPFDFHKGVFTVHTKDTGRAHDLRAKLTYINLKEDRTRFIPGTYLFNICFECWEKAKKDNNGNGVCGELLYTEKCRVFLHDAANVNPAKWYQHGVPTGEYDIKIRFERANIHTITRDGIYSASSVTIPFRLLP